MLKQKTGSHFHLEAKADHGVAKSYMEDVTHRERRCFHVRDKDVPQKGNVISKH